MFKMLKCLCEKAASDLEKVFSEIDERNPRNA